MDKYERIECFGTNQARLIGRDSSEVGTQFTGDVNEVAKRLVHHVFNHQKGRTLIDRYGELKGLLDTKVYIGASENTQNQEFLSAEVDKQLYSCDVVLQKMTRLDVESDRVLAEVTQIPILEVVGEVSLDSLVTEELKRVLADRKCLRREKNIASTCCCLGGVSSFLWIPTTSIGICFGVIGLCCSGLVFDSGTLDCQQQYQEGELSKALNIVFYT